MSEENEPHHVDPLAEHDRPWHTHNTWDNRTEPSHEDVMRIADQQIERWGEAFKKMAERDSHGHTTGLETDAATDGS